MARSISYQWGRISQCQSTVREEERLTTDLIIVVTDPGTPASGGALILTQPRIGAYAILRALRNGEISLPIASGPLVLAEGSNVFDGGPQFVDTPAGVIQSIQVAEEADAPQGRVYRVTVVTSLHADRSSFQPPSVQYSMQSGSVGVSAFRVNTADAELLFPDDEGWTQIGTSLLYKMTGANWYAESEGLNASATITGTPVSRDSAGTEVGTDRPEGDIGGQYVDWSGKPVEFPLAITTHTISVVRNAPFLDLSGTAPDVDYDYGDQTTIQNQQGFIGARNTADMFRTGDVGRLMLKSIDMQPLGSESQRVTYTFVEHPWRHALQVPRQVFGSGFFAMKYLDDPRLIQHTVGVYWQQNHTFGADFASAGVLFTDAELRVVSELYHDANP